MNIEKLPDRFTSDKKGLSQKSNPKYLVQWGRRINCLHEAVALDRGRGYI